MTSPTTTDQILLNGTEGDDNLVGTPGADVICGQAGQDMLSGLAGNDSLLGEAGDDTLVGGAGDDTLVGGAGDDTVIVNNFNGIDSFDGGAGQDTIRFEPSDGRNLTIFVEQGGVGDRRRGGQSFQNFEHIITGDGNDNLIGDANDNSLSAGAGNDTLTGGAGDDTLTGGTGDDLLVGGEGDDTLNGGGGIDTADYSEAVSSVNVDLTAGTTTITSPIRLMPLGDSITEGLETDPDGGYRIPLWNSFVSDGFDIDFVGSLQTGPPTIDVDHEGHGGIRINGVAESVNGWLDAAQPDTILLMIGTNDILANFDLENAPDRLSSLIDQITAQAPDADLFVSSIAPGERAVDDTQQTIDFNAAIQPIIEAKGGNVTFVDINSQLSLSDLIDEIHPNAVGYEKIADAWYEAIADEISSNNIIEQDTLSSIENVIGSTFRDTLTGNNGANLLTGGEGSDVLTGNGGSDRFIYTALSEGGDTITDFGSDDFFQISAAAFGGGLTSGVALSTVAAAAGSFVSGSSPSPLGSSANFLYDTSDPNQGVLRFDSDGTGSSSSSILATLTGAPGLTADQFIIV